MVLDDKHHQVLHIFHRLRAESGSSDNQGFEIAGREINKMRI